MKRVFKITIILLLVVLVLAAGGWLLARKKAVQNGQTQPTFREFLTRQSKSGSEQQTPGLTPDTAADGSSNTTKKPDTAAPTPSSGPITVSQFTSAPVTPSGQVTDVSPLDNGFATGAGVELGTGINTSPISIPGTPITQTIQGLPDIALGGCQDTDVNIQFTAEEIRRLNELQSQFLQIAGTLHTDADTQAEQANYTLFKDKLDTNTELYNYCLSKGFAIGTTTLKNRVATPFWRMPGRDKSGYLRNGEWDDGIADPRLISESEMMLEHLFKLHLW